MAAYTDLTTNERLAYHRRLVDWHRDLERLNQRYQIALTSQERTALRQAATPILTAVAAWSYDSVAGTIPDD